MSRPIDLLPAGLAVDPSASGSFPCGPSGAHEEVGLALSGGGYRATLFHVGALYRLNELGWLPRIDRISSVSGGSLMAGLLATRWTKLTVNQATGVADNFRVEILDRTMRFTRLPIDVFVIGLGLIPLFNPADVMDRILGWTLTNHHRLAGLPDRPRFIINAANLATGESWRFSKAYMADSRLGVICEPDVALSRAIAASAAYPPFVAPLVLDLRGMTISPMDGTDLYDDPSASDLKKRVLLLDGGAYDNLGVEAVEGRCRIVLASDAGGNLQADQRAFRYRFWWPLVRRTLDLAVEVGRRQRRRALIGGSTDAAALARLGSPQAGVTQEVALWRTALQVSGHPKLPAGWTVDPGWARYCSSISTRMWPMSSRDQQRLVNWGYLTADLMLRTWIADLEAADPPTRLPFEHITFESPPLS